MSATLIRGGIVFPMTGRGVAFDPGSVLIVALGGLHTTPVLHGDDFNVAARLVFSASAAVELFARRAAQAGR